MGIRLGRVRWYYLLRFLCSSCTWRFRTPSISRTATSTDFNCCCEPVLSRWSLFSEFGLIGDLDNDQYENEPEELSGLGVAVVEHGDLHDRSVCFTIQTKLDERAYSLCSVLTYQAASTQLEYEYDFGDNWEMTLELICLGHQVVDTYPRCMPRCISGAGSDPIEDSGGRRVIRSHTHTHTYSHVIFIYHAHACLCVPFFGKSAQSPLAHRLRGPSPTWMSMHAWRTRWPAAVATRVDAMRVRTTNARIAWVLAPLWIQPRRVVVTAWCPMRTAWECWGSLSS